MNGDERRITRLGPDLVAAGIVFLAGSLLPQPKSRVTVGLGAAVLIILATLDLLMEFGLNWPRRWLSPARVALIAGLAGGGLVYALTRTVDTAYITASLIAVVVLIFAALAYRGSDQRELQTLTKIAADVEQVRLDLETDTTALTATCIPFQDTEGDQVFLYLIRNKNFGGWWLAPGAHCERGADGFEYPDQIAVARCLDEASLDVRLVEVLPRMTGRHDDCSQRVSPHFAYELTILPTAKCAKKHHHKEHYDLTFVGEVMGVGKETEASLERLKIALSRSADATAVQIAIQNAASQWAETHSQKLAANQFPPDFPARVAAALKVFVASRKQRL